MKILWVFNHPAPYKVRLFNEIAKYVDLEIIFERTKAKDRPNEFYNCNEYNFPVHFFKHGYFGNENSFSGELKRFIKKNHQNYDLIIMNGYSKISEIKAIRYLKHKKIPFALYINGGVVRKENAFKRWYKKGLISAAKWYFSPSIEADKYLLNYGIKQEQIYHYPYSTLYEGDISHTPLNAHDKEERRKQYGLPNNEIFVNASQFINRKNNLQVINIFKNLDKSLLLIGEGPEKKQYEELIEKENIKNVYILPFKKKDELFKILQCCDYFITLSKEDIYGHTINEALANGLPVISSTQVIGAHTMIDNGINGFIVPLNDKEIIKAINQVKPSMVQDAINKAKYYTIENSSQVHLNIFKEILK